MCIKIKKKMKIKIKTVVYDTTVNSVMLFGAETWTTSIQLEEVAVNRDGEERWWEKLGKILPATY